MNKLNKVAIAVAAASFVSFGAQAAVGSLDAVRDNLKGLYDHLGGAGTWDGTNSATTRDELIDVAEYGGKMSQVTFSFSLGEGVSLSYKHNFDQDTFDGHVDALSDAVATDLFGATDLSSINLVTVDANGGMESALSSDDIFHSKLDTELGLINTAIYSGDVATIDTAITTFDTNMETFNEKWVDFYDEVKDGGTGLSSVDGRQDAINYGVRYDKTEGHFVSGSGDDVECYASYEDYAKDITKSC